MSKEIVTNGPVREVVKAKVNFIDAAGRIVCITESNEAALVYLSYGDAAPVTGQEILLEREEGKRRITDWKISK